MRLQIQHSDLKWTHSERERELAVSPIAIHYSPSLFTNKYPLVREAILLIIYCVTSLLCGSYNIFYQYYFVMELQSLNTFNNYLCVLLLALSRCHATSYSVDISCLVMSFTRPVSVSPGQMAMVRTPVRDTWYGSCKIKHICMYGLYQYTYILITILGYPEGIRRQVARRCGIVLM